MSAEQFVDAIATLTGNWKNSPAKKIKFDGANLEKKKDTDVPEANWIWSNADAAKNANPGSAYFRKSFELPGKPKTADVIVSADNTFVLLVNHRNGMAGNNWKELKFRNLADRFKAGRNVVTVMATNSGEDASPAGLWLGIRFQFEDGSTKDVISDKTWKVNTEDIKGWNKPEYDDSKWSTASELGGLDVAPWRLAKELKVNGSDLAFGGKFRESLQNKTALTTALGRPNREQIGRASGRERV